MNTWRVEKESRLLTEIKKRLLGKHTGKDLKWSIEHNRCFVNHKLERFGSRTLQKGDTVSIWPDKSPSFKVEKEAILYEDPHLFVYNKPPYLSSEQLAELTGHLLVHRLDRDTSGALLMAKNENVQGLLEQQFKERKIKKTYLACVEGKPPKEGTITERMAIKQRREGAVIWGISSTGLWSQTHFQCLILRPKNALMRCIPMTGRTHQLRVHLAHIGYPIVGDPTYGSKERSPGIFRPLLHAESLALIHPIEKLGFEVRAPLPADFPFSPREK